MSKPRISLLNLVAVPFAMAAGSAVHADDATTGQGGANVLQEVVVTAQKREEKLHDVPMGVTAITSDDLQSQQLVSFADLEARIPGLSVELIAPGQDRLTIRGENVGGVGSTVTTYIDDTPFGSSNALANGSINAGDFDTWDMQRVEVLRGPQGTLYGAGSEGGLLKYVTNPPDPTQFEGALQVGGEDIAHGGDAGSWKAMVNLPLGSTAAFRISGYDTSLPGFINDVPLGETQINASYQAGLRASLLFELGDSFSIRLSGFGQKLHTDGTPYVDVIGSAGTPLTPPADQLQPATGLYNQQRFINEPSTYLYKNYSASLNWNLGWGTATAITSYGTTDQDIFTDATSQTLEPGVTFGDLAGSVTGVNTGVGEISDLDVKKFTEEVRVASASSQTLEWQVGAFYTRESSTLDQALPTFFIPSQANTGLESLETIALTALYREWAGFGEVTYHFNPQFDIGLGGRWSQDKQSADQTTGGLLVNPPQLTSGTSSGNDFTYSVAPRWHVSKDTLVYARVASGYRPGGPNALPPGAPVGVAHSYKADSTVNYELGLRTSFLDNRLSADVAAFVIDWTKIQLLQIVENIGINANGGTARSKGVEWTFGLTPVTGLNFTLTGAYVDAYLTSAAPAAGANDGDPLPYAPKVSTSLDGSYTFPAFGDMNAFFGATWSYIGTREDDFSASTEVVGGVVVSVPNPRAQLPDYETVNLRLGLENKKWMLQFYCKNVGDTRGITYYTSQGTPNFGGVIGIAQPRTLGVALTARF
jgi:iron complex outermembrane recepter protein